eukprot:2968747-Prymnesium_polylepis.1
MPMFPRPIRTRGAPGATCVYHTTPRSVCSVIARVWYSLGSAIHLEPRVARSPAEVASRSPARWPGCQVARSPGRQVARSPVGRQQVASRSPAGRQSHRVRTGHRWSPAGRQ